MCRFSVNVFQPPFQSGRTSPETSQSRVDLPPVPAGSPDGPGLEDEAVGGSSTVGAGNLELESHASLPESQAEYAQASAIHSGDSESLSSSQTSLSTTRTTDSGFSESLSSASCCFLDPHAEKETSCEKAVRPEGKCIVQILHYFGDLPFFFFFFFLPSYLNFLNVLQLQSQGISIRVNLLQVMLVSSTSLCWMQTTRSKGWMREVPPHFLQN